MNELDKKFQELGWRDTTEAYYGLGFTPFMNVIEEHIEEIKSYLDEIGLIYSESVVPMNWTNILQ